MSTKRKKRFASSEDLKESEELETEDIYEDKQREEMLIDDEITAVEDGFMRGRELTPKGVKRLRRSGHEDTVSVELAEEDYGDD